MSSPDAGEQRRCSLSSMLTEIRVRGEATAGAQRLCAPPLRVHRTGPRT